MRATTSLKLCATAGLGAASSLAIIYSAQTITMGDLLAIGALASVVTLVGTSFLRKPGQFCRALYERVRYVILVPLCVALVIALFALRLAVLLLKLAVKASLSLLLWLAYLISPIDLVFDWIPVLGMIDDIVLLVTVSIWALSGVLTSSLRSQITVSRPKTSFP